MPVRAAVEEIACDCLAARVRVIGRAVTALYEAAIAEHGLTIAQLNLLAALGKIGVCRPAKLGEILQLERSTVSRNLDLLLKHRWVKAVTADAKGVREVTLTAAGLKKIEAALPAWRVAQTQAVHLLGAPGVQAVRRVADRVWTHSPAASR